MELELIRQIRDRAAVLSGSRHLSAIRKSIGDDCAEVIPSEDMDILATTDTMCEGIHFGLSYFSPFQLGRKLASVNLSDIAAMGGIPRWALLNAEVPKKLGNADDPFWQAFLQGLTSRLAEFNALLIGGDTVAAPSSRLAFTLTVIGEIEKGGAVYRSGAKNGDLVYCSGYTGESACGMELLAGPGLAHLIPRPACRKLMHKHLDPEPRIMLGRALAAAGISSLIDLSDGIASDLANVCKESKLAAVIDASILPVSRLVRLFCHNTRKKRGEFLPRATWEYVLCGGEDFELLWTVSEKRCLDAEEAAIKVLGHRPAMIGRMQEGSGCYIDTGHGLVDISFRGYEH